MVNNISGSEPVNYPQGNGLPDPNVIDAAASGLLTQTQLIKDEQEALASQICNPNTSPSDKAVLEKKMNELTTLEVAILKVEKAIDAYQSSQNPANLQNIKDAMPNLQTSYTAVSQDYPTKYSQIQTSIDELNKLLGS